MGAVMIINEHFEISFKQFQSQTSSINKNSTVEVEFDNDTDILMDKSENKEGKGIE